MTVSPNQDVAYEHAVLQARADPRLHEVVREAFLHENALEAYEAFIASEHWSRAQRLLASAVVQPGSRILELGGGRGLLSAALAGIGHEVTLCEINPSDVCGAGAARSLMRLLDLPVRIVQAPVEELAATLEPQHAIICRAVIHHLDPIHPPLAAACDALEPDGVFVAVDEPTVRRSSDLEELRRHHPFVQFGVDETAFTIRAYRQALRDAGFTGIRVLFPVSYAGYRQYARAGAPHLIALPRYVLYRLRSAVVHPPGEVRSLIARRSA